MAAGRSPGYFILPALVFIVLAAGQILFLDMDRCLDAGGAYDYSAFACRGAPAPFVSMLQGGGTILLWGLVFLGSALAAIVFDRIVNAITRAVGRKRASQRSAGGGGGCE